ncbi:MAG: transporter substrate-binding domain-containing protein [SAR324 cluster bacterium]|nr:transporter substrate-binding domain-containing protein [SAR324 cluster bacterium]
MQENIAMKFFTLFFLVILNFQNISFGQDSRMVKVGIYNFKPLVYINEAGEAKGLFVDVLNHIAKEKKWEINYIPGSWQECLSRLQSGEIDILTNVAQTEDRNKIMDFTENYLFLDWGVVYRKNNSPIDTIFDLQDKTIGVLNRGRASGAFQQLLDQFGIRSRFLKNENYTQIFEAIEKSEVDVGLFLNTVAIELASNYDVEQTPIVFSPAKFKFAAKENQNREILSTLDKGISELKTDKNSIYYQSLHKGINAYEPNEIIPPWLITALLVIILVSFILVVFNIVLRKSIRYKTSKLVETNERLEKEIDERSRAEELLKQSEGRLNNLLQSIQAGVVVHDVKQSRIIQFNATALDILGMTADQVLGKSTIDPGWAFIHENNKPMSVDEYPVNIVKQTKRPLWDYIVGIVKDSKVEPTWAIIKATPQFDKDGEMFEIIVSSMDITELKRTETKNLQLEAHLFQTQKLEAIGTLAGGIAHDFNNMLGIIYGNVSYLLNDYSENEEIVEVLSDIQEGAKKAQNLTQQLLTFAKGGAPIKKTTNINKLIKDSAIFVTRGAKSKCNFDLADDLWSAEVDAGQLNQVISNLVINASQAMPIGGIITIRSENIEIEKGNTIHLPTGKYIKIILEDQGVGISEKNLPNIFDPYFTTKQTGSGLGLSTSYSIIKNHGGHIGAVSKLDEGTTFNIFLPASDNEIPAVDKKLTIANSGHGKILVMDDEEPILKMVGRMLNRMGYEPYYAKDGEQVIEIYRTALQSGKQFKLVILDLTIPGGMGGKETIEKLLQINPDVKAVVSSGYSNDPVMSNYKKYGFCGVIPKPYSQDEVAKVFNEINS